MQSLWALIKTPFVAMPFVAAPLIAAFCAAPVCLVSPCLAQPGQEVSLFNGRDLAGWTGDAEFWFVEDGILTGRTSVEHTLKHSEYLFSDITASDFELSFKYRIVGGNSGMQYRSRRRGEWDVAGYQADIEDGPTYTGALYESAGRGVMALRGEHATFTADRGKITHAPLGDAQSLNDAIKDEDWNEYGISARGNTLTHTINGVVMVRVTDNDTTRSAASGLFALQVHQGPPMLVQYKDFHLVTFEPAEPTEQPEKPTPPAEPISRVTPEWIWAHDAPTNDESVYLRHTFTLDTPPKNATLIASGDNHATVYINGKQLIHTDDWMNPGSAHFTAPLKRGKNTIAAKVRNDAGPAAFAAALNITNKNDRIIHIFTNNKWKASTTAAENWNSTNFDDQTWTLAHSFGPVTAPDGPWHNVFNTEPPAPKQATPIEAINVPEGFKVELLYSAQAGQGSWVSMAFDDKGRIFVSPQSGRMLKATLDGVGGKVVSLEHIALDVGAAQGLLYAYDALYVTVTAPPTKNGGLHRLTDTTGDGKFDKDEHLSAYGNMSEHGAHGIVLGPDGMLYTIHGNYTPLPEGVSEFSPFRGYQEDLLLPRLWDPRGHAVGIMTPAARVLRTDKDGKNWEIVSAGMRNPYDIAFNPEGELFAYDADMEWDIGAPWYRAPRVVHNVSGSEFGWRGGTGKWPSYYPDSLPAVVDTDLSSPTGMLFGTKAKFPKKYRDALFIGDWAYGRILATHLTPDGASYTGTYEEFATGKPLNVTDFEIGPDGAMYFVTGGRGTQSGLYRITYVGNDDMSTGSTPDAGIAARATRRMLERLHGRPTPNMLGTAWPYLDSDDRFIRFAARVVLEHADANDVWERTRSERRPWARLEALLACAKICDVSVQESIVTYELNAMDFGSLSAMQQLAFIRVYMVSFARTEEPSPSALRTATTKLDSLYPAATPELNRELSRILVYLKAPVVAERTLALLHSSTDIKQQMHFALVLRLVVEQLDDNKQIEYFSWLKQANSMQGGLSLPGFIASIEREALESLDQTRRDAIASAVLNAPVETLPQVERKKAFVKAWTMADLAPLLNDVASGRSFERGREMFAATQCIDCHRIGGLGGSTAPDLTGASGRFSRTDLLETMLFPSKIISDQYETVLVTRTKGDAVMGWIVEQNDDQIVVNTDPRQAARITIKRSNVASITVLPISLMPEGLLQVLTLEEILDLLAYIEAGGDADADNFK